MPFTKKSLSIQASNPQSKGADVMIAPAHRNGFTLIELLVSLSIIALVLSLAIPAIVSSRETARRIACMNNQKQLATSLNLYESSNGGFPSAGFLRNSSVPKRYSIFPPQTWLLCELGYSNAYNSINFSLPNADLNDAIKFNQTALESKVNVFLCPSDPMSSNYEGRLSYRANIGTDQIANYTNSQKGAVDTGLFKFLQPLTKTNEITDGLSNTLAFSEKTLGSGLASPYSSFRDSVEMKEGYGSTATEWLQICSNITSELVQRSQWKQSGASWMNSGAYYSAFLATAPPNSLVVDCGCNLNNGSGIFSSRSYHNGGVISSLADGSVRFFSSSTDPRLWRSLSSPSGNELGTLIVD